MTKRIFVWGHRQDVGLTMAAESSIEKSFVRWCEKQGYPCLKLVLLTQRGWPDRAVMLPGNKVCWIEMKAPGGRTSPQQEYWIRKQREAGHNVFVCDSVESAINAVTQVSTGC